MALLLVAALVLALASALLSVLWFHRILQAPEVALDSRGRIQT